MLIAIGLFISGLFYPYSPAIVPERAGYVSQDYYAGESVVSAHSHLAGAVFYDLQAGDVVREYYSNGSHIAYVVTGKDYLVADRPSEQDINLFYNGAWMPIMDVVQAKSDNDMTLFTCWYQLDYFRGRLFVNLERVNDEQ